MLHTLSYRQPGGWGVAGAWQFFDANNTSTLAPDASGVKKNGWMIWWMLALEIWTSKIPTVLLFFWAFAKQNIFTAQATCKFCPLSHTSANWNECPFCKHVLTNPTNTSILSVRLEYFNFKFVTLTKAASQPVAFLVFHILWPEPGFTKHLFSHHMFDNFQCKCVKEQNLETTNKPKQNEQCFRWISDGKGY